MKTGGEWKTHRRKAGGYLRDTETDRLSFINTVTTNYSMWNEMYGIASHENQECMISLLCTRDVCTNTVIIKVRGI